ncbi:MAG: hypothetical protein GQ538_01685, partial [Xanthomonadales bacterium]|nr:hypothetical protein [Xanthomonadales bacterium]
MRIVHSAAVAMALICATFVVSAPAIQAADFTHLEGNPKLKSASALVVNSDGEVIYGK